MNGMNQVNHNNMQNDPNGMPISPNSPHHFNQGQPPQQHYTIPGILKFIQSEWAKFELERAHWKIAKAEYISQIASLHGRERGQMSIRKDLIRRIKMLEFALKQERQKYYLQKTGIDMDIHSNGNNSDYSDSAESDYNSDSSNSEGDKNIPDGAGEGGPEPVKPENFDSQGPNDANPENGDLRAPDMQENKENVNILENGPNAQPPKKKRTKKRKIPPNFVDKVKSGADNHQKVDGVSNRQSEFYWRHGRQLLREYLNEVGYTDAILDVRAQRLRHLLNTNESVLYKNLAQAEENAMQTRENNAKNLQNLTDQVRQQNIENGNIDPEHENINLETGNLNNDGGNSGNTGIANGRGQNDNHGMTNSGNNNAGSGDNGNTATPNIPNDSGDHHNFENLGTIKKRPEDSEFQKELYQRESNYTALFDRLSKPVLDVPDPDLQLEKSYSGLGEDGIEKNGQNGYAWWNQEEKPSLNFGMVGINKENGSDKLGELNNIQIDKKDSEGAFGQLLGNFVIF